MVLILHRAKEVISPLCSGINREGFWRKSYPDIARNPSGLVLFHPVLLVLNIPSLTMLLAVCRKLISWNWGNQKPKSISLPPTPLCTENTWLQECSWRDFFPPLAYTVNGRAPSLNKQCGWWLLCEAHVKDAIIFLLCSALNHVKLAWLPHITLTLLQTITYRVSSPNFAGKKITINSPSFKCLIVYKVHWPH